MVQKIVGAGNSKKKPKRHKDMVANKQYATKKIQKAKGSKMRSLDMIDLNRTLRGRGDLHALDTVHKPRQASLYRQVINNYRALDEKLGGVLPGGGHLKEYARGLTYLVSGGDPQNPIPEEPLLKTWDDRNVRNNNTKLNPK